MFEHETFATLRRRNFWGLRSARKQLRLNVNEVIVIFVLHVYLIIVDNEYYKTSSKKYAGTITLCIIGT